MNWTKTAPTKTGAYWWRKDSNHKSYLAYVFLNEESDCFCVKKLNHDHFERVSKTGGEWCGPLLPAEELEKAYHEGVFDANSNMHGLEARRYNGSRARRVAEGEEA